MAAVEYLTVSHLDRVDLARFFSRVTVNTRTGCWEWVGGTNADGYGRFVVNGRMESSHRVMFAWLVRPILRGQKNGPVQNVLDHVICDNPKCCNPAHVVETTSRANILRSNCLGAINARKTHCKYGHPLSEPIPPSGHRRCHICHRSEWHRSPQIRRSRHLARIRRRAMGKKN